MLGAVSGFSNTNTTQHSTASTPTSAPATSSVAMAPYDCTNLPSPADLQWSMPSTYRTQTFTFLNYKEAGVRRPLEFSLPKTRSQWGISEPPPGRNGPPTLSLDLPESDPGCKAFLDFIDGVYERLIDAVLANGKEFLNSPGIKREVLDLSGSVKNPIRRAEDNSGNAYTPRIEAKVFDPTEEEGDRANKPRSYIFINPDVGSGQELKGADLFKVTRGAEVRAVVEIKQASIIDGKIYVVTLRTSPKHVFTGGLVLQPFFGDFFLFLNRSSRAAEDHAQTGPRQAQRRERGLPRRGRRLHHPGQRRRGRGRGRGRQEQEQGGQGQDGGQEAPAHPARGRRGGRQRRGGRGGRGGGQ